MFMVLALMLERHGQLRLVLLCLASSAGISLTVRFGQPDVLTYRGLSGVDTALFVCFACLLLASAWQDRRWSGCILPAVLLAGFAAKLIYETVTGAAVFVDSHHAGFAVAAPAHVVGATMRAAFGWAATSRLRGSLRFTTRIRKTVQATSG